MYKKPVSTSGRAASNPCWAARVMSVPVFQEAECLVDAMKKLQVMKKSQVHGHLEM